MDEPESRQQRIPRDRFLRLADRPWLQAAVEEGGQHQHHRRRGVDRRFIPQCRHGKATQHWPEHGGELADTAAPGRGVAIVMCWNDRGKQGPLRRAVEDASDADQEEAGIDHPERSMQPGEQGEDRGRTGIQRHRADSDPLVIVPIDVFPGGQRKEDIRDDLHQPDQAKRQRGIGAQVEFVADDHAEDRARERAQEVAGDEQPEIAEAECRVGIVIGWGRHADPRAGGDGGERDTADPDTRRTQRSTPGRSGDACDPIARSEK
jgi:hypothetical protein